MFIVFLLVILATILAITAVYFQKDNKIKIIEVTNVTINQWWAKKRAKYNAGLIIAGFTSFIAYVILGEILIAPYDTDFEVTLFTIIFQGVAI